METVMTTPVVVTDMKRKVQDILMSVSWRDFANTYFQKSSSWFYHKMDGIFFLCHMKEVVDNHPAHHTDQCRDKRQDVVHTFILNPPHNKNSYDNAKRQWHKK